MPITEHPLHRSGRADLPHPAPTSGNDAKAAERVEMTDARRRQSAIDVPLHPRTSQTMALTAPPKRAQPESSDLVPKGAQRVGVHRHAVVTDVPANDAAQPRALFADGPVHASPQLRFHVVQLRVQPFAHRVPKHREASVASLLPADVREAKNVERLRLPEACGSPILRPGKNY